MKKESMEADNYKNFIIISVISFAIMYAAMFSSINELGHFYNSLTMLYMTLVMICPMALVMLLLMGEMYSNKKWNTIIITALAIIFVLSLIFLRIQFGVDDKDYLRHMISHHSSAILTSTHANLQDPEVKELAKKILETQEREIGQMKGILERLG